jgi:branched-chain amino acid transport system permease protein
MMVAGFWRETKYLCRKRRGWVLAISFLIAMLTWPVIFPDPFYLHLSIFLFVYIIGAISLNLTLRTGLLSFAHAGFMGIGAYTSALLVMRGGLPFVLAFPVAGLVPGLVSVILGPIILRLKGVYFVLVTFVFGEVIRLLFVTWKDLTGGPNGVYDISPPRLDFVFSSVTLGSQISMYYFSFLIALLVCATCVALNKSEFGRALNSISENEVLAESVGMNVLKYKILAFSLGTFMVGLGGAVFAHYTRYISPADFTWRLNLDLLAFNVVGGINYVVGPVLGSLVLMPLAELLRSAVEYQWIIYSALMILMVLFLPEGLASLESRLRIGLRTHENHLHSGVQEQ